MILGQLNDGILSLILISILNGMVILNYFLQVDVDDEMDSLILILIQMVMVSLILILTSRWIGYALDFWVETVNANDA